MWIKTVLLTLMIVSAHCAVKYSLSKNNLHNRNQRIIKVHATPQSNHFHKHPHKHVVTRPLMVQQIDATKDFIRSSHSHSNPSFFNGPSTNHIKHLSRPPPHVVHKIPSYGIGFPYKNINSLRTSAFKAPFRAQASGAVRPSSIKQTSQITQVAKPTKVIPSPSVLPAPQIPIKETSSSTSLYSPTIAYSNFFSSSPIRHIISSDDNNGPIKEIPAPNLGPKPNGGAGFNNLKHLQSTAFANTLDEPVVKINTGVRKPALDANTQIKDFNKHQFFERKPSIEIKDLDQSNSNDVNKLFRNVASSATYNFGYEVKEPNNNIATNDQVLKSLGREKYYYAPDPDPSLPVHKVPPTNDPQSTPTNGQSINSLYFPQLTYGFPYLPGAPAGGSVATLTAQELYQLMQGYPTILSQPQPQAVVSFVSQPQANGVIVQELSQNYYNQQNTKEIPQENDVAQYLQRPDIHNLIHNTPENLPQQSTVTSSISSPPKNPEAYSHQSIYQDFDQPQEESENLNLETSEADDLSGPDSNNNYDFEPEASESKNSFTVIRQSNEGTQGSTKVKKLLLEDSSLNNLNFQINDDEVISSERTPEIFELKNVPEVPLYSSLPNQQAAEALAGLQAAGSVASNYINRIKVERGNEDEEDLERRGKANNQVEDERFFETGSRKTVIDLNNSIQKGTTPSVIAESVDDEAISEDNTEFTLEGQIEEDSDNEDFKDNLEIIPFGKRLRPK